MHTLPEDDQLKIKQIRAGETLALEELYLQAIPIITTELGGERIAQRFLQDAIIKLRKDIRRNQFQPRAGESLVEHLARLVRERWEKHQKDKELDHKIIECLNSEQDSGWAYYYMQRYYFPAISYYIRTNGGTEEDAKDLIMDSIYVLLKNIQDGKYVPQESASLKTYFFAICKNKWRAFYKKKKSSIVVPLIDGYDAADDASNYYMAFEEDLLNERQRAVADVFQKATEKCHKILSFFYYDSLSHTEIAEKMGYQNANTSKEQKKRCMNKLRTEIVKRFDDEALD